MRVSYFEGVSIVSICSRDVALYILYTSVVRVHSLIPRKGGGGGGGGGGIESTTRLINHMNMSVSTYGSQ